MLDTFWIQAPKAAIDTLELNVLNSTHGGPVFMALGEGIDLDMLEALNASELVVV